MLADVLFLAMHDIGITRQETWAVASTLGCQLPWRNSMYISDA